MSVEGAGATGGGGGGFDTSSSDEGWCGRGVGLRDFERASAENTRIALLKNDAQLCEPPPPPPPLPGKQQQQQPPLRFVPGDPFANEEADVGAWARHFTYLAVTPSGTAFSQSLEPPQSAEKETGAGFDEEAAVNSRLGEKSGASAEAVESKARGRAAAPVTVAAATAAAAEEQGEEDHEREQKQQCKGEGGLEEEESDGEEGEYVYASHGVYEEYLAYDCRPPESDENEDSQRFAAEEAADANFITATAAAREGQGRWPNTTHGGEGRALRRRLDTPQRELRQEIMDRLFDEVWDRLTPDLVLLLELDAKNADAGAGGGGGRPGGEGKCPESLVGDGGSGGGGVVGERASVVDSGRGSFATKFGRDYDGFRRNSMEH